MLEFLLVSNPWVATAMVLAGYLSGYATALYEAHLYYAGAQDHFAYRPGYPLAREYADTLGRRRIASWRFLAQLLVMAVLVPLAWQAALQRFGRPELFWAVTGGLILAEAAETMQHLHNVALFRQALRDTVSGKIEYQRRATLTVRYVDLYGLAGLYFLIFLVTGSWFCAGGALACVVSAQRSRDWVIMRT